MLGCQCIKWVFIDYQALSHIKQSQTMTNTNQAACMVDIPMNNYIASLALRGAEKTFYIIFQYRHGQHYMLKNCTCNV